MRLLLLALSLVACSSVADDRPTPDNDDAAGTSLPCPWDSTRFCVQLYGRLTDAPHCGPGVGTEWVRYSEYTGPGPWTLAVPLDRGGNLMPACPLDTETVVDELGFFTSVTDCTAFNGETYHQEVTGLISAGWHGGNSVVTRTSGDEPCANNWFVGITK